MEITITKVLKLYPIGNIHFVFTRSQRVAKGKTKLWIGEMHTLNETDLPISKEVETKLHKMMKATSDVLTDGSKFYTTRGLVITEIRHPLFKEELEKHIVLYGNDFESYFADLK